jgi:hypothetical protein
VREDNSIRQLGAVSFDSLLRRCNPFSGGGNTLDLREVQFISSAALVQLAAVAHGLAKQGEALQLLVEDQSVRTYLARSGFLGAVRDIAVIDPPYDETTQHRFDHLVGSNPLLLEVTKMESGACLPPLLDRIDYLVEWFENAAIGRLGNINEDTWRAHHDAWQRDLDEIETIIRTTTFSIPREEFLQRAKRPLELLQTAADQYVAQTPEERRRLLHIMCSNYTISDGTLTVSMRSPFDALAKAAESGDWLGGRESNPDSLVQSQLSYH